MGITTLPWEIPFPTPPAKWDLTLVKPLGIIPTPFQKVNSHGLKSMGTVPHLTPWEQSQGFKSMGISPTQRSMGISPAQKTMGISPTQIVMGIYSIKLTHGKHLQIDEIYIFANEVINDPVHVLLLLDEVLKFTKLLVIESSNVGCESLRWFIQDGGDRIRVMLFHCKVSDTIINFAFALNDNYW